MLATIITKQQIKQAKNLLQQRVLAQIISKKNVYETTDAQTIKNNNEDANFIKRTKLYQQKMQTTSQKNKLKLIPNIDPIDAFVATNEVVADKQNQLQTSELDTDLTDIRFILYKDKENQLWNEITNSSTHKMLLQTLQRHTDDLQKEHCVQAVLVYCDLITNRTNNCHKSLNIADHPILSEILQLLKPHLQQMNTDELSCCYYYLRQIGLTKSNEIVRDILLNAINIVETTPISEIDTETTLIPLTTLSRLALSINIYQTFHTPLVCQNFMSHIEKHIKYCKTAESARLLAICFMHLQQLVDAEMLDDFKTRIKYLLETNILNGLTPKPLVKILNMLNLVPWSAKNTQLIRDLLLTLQPSIEQLNQMELKHICRLYHHHLEPAALAAPLRGAIEKLLAQQPNADSLSCYVAFAHPQERDELYALFKQLLKTENCQQQFVSHNLFIILRTLRIADVRICNDYWQLVTDELDACNADELQYRYLRNCHHYMNFNNNLGGTYRYIPLEQKLSQLCMHAIENELGGRIPSKFARLASFVLAYGHTPFNWKKFPNLILSKIISMTPQFSINDCAMLSRGVQVALEMRFRHNTSFILKMQLSTIDSLITECAERHLNEKNLNINELNLIVRMLTLRKSLKNTVVYHEAFNKYKAIHSNELNSRTIREMIFNFNASNFLVPQALDATFDYIAQHFEHISGDLVERVLTCAYNLGYTPKTLTPLTHAAYVLIRDFDYISGLSLVQACLALCYYKNIPTDLIDKVFCVKFIQRIDDEINKCYSRATYPERVLNIVMQLNRTVCLDFPEANVPWFQQNFVEAQLSKAPKEKTEFSNDVKSLLKNLLKDETYFRCNHTTPYGYQIDFVIHFDRDKQQPIPSPIETTMLDRITKVAILLLKLDSFCENDLTALRGPTSLKIKHLEMMGYKVLHINEHDWNSKYMNVPGAKKNYLKCLLKITN